MTFHPTIVQTRFGVVALFDELPPYGANGNPLASLSLSYEKVSLAAELTPAQAGELGAALVHWATTAHAVVAEEGEDNPCPRRGPRFTLADDGEGGEADG